MNGSGSVLIDNDEIITPSVEKIIIGHNLADVRAIIRLIWIRMKNMKGRYTKIAPNHGEENRPLSTSEML